MSHCVNQAYNFETTLIRSAWTTLNGNLVSLGWHIPFQSDNTNTHPVMAPACTNAPMSTRQRWGSSLFTFYSPLKDTDLYQGWPALCVPSLSPPICHWVRERLLMLLKGQREERQRCSVCLRLSRWLQTLPIHHCLPQATSFCLPFHQWIADPPGRTYTVELC